jgi:uncharacterized protein
MFIDPLYLMFALPGLLLALYASFKTKATFARYSRIASSNGMTGAQAAAALLRRAGVGGVRIEQVGGLLSDHYDPISRTLRLSPPVYASNSLAAIGVACHEAGHAIQHGKGFVWMHLRTAMVPATNVSTWLSYALIMLGFLIHSQQWVLFGAIVFSAAVLFSIVTLPVEWDASRRAKQLMVVAGVVPAREAADAGRVLNAAFLTYVAAAVSSLLTLLYYLMRAGVFGRRD